jgi:hypothetical protein
VVVEVRCDRLTLTGWSTAGGSNGTSDASVSPPLEVELANIQAKTGVRGGEGLMRKAVNKVLPLAPFLGSGPCGASSILNY